jgi:nitric oxide reductase activation protein
VETGEDSDEPADQDGQAQAAGSPSGDIPEDDSDDWSDGDEDDFDDDDDNQMRGGEESEGSSPNASKNATASSVQSDGQGGTGESQAPSIDEIRKRIRQQTAADAEDSMDPRKQIEKAIEDLMNRNYRNLQTVEDLAAVSEQSDSKDKKLEKFEKEKARLEKKLKDYTEDRSKRGRFTLAELKEMIRRMEVILTPMNLEESKSLAEMTELRVEMGPEFQPDPTSTPQKCIVTHPVVTPELRTKYKAYYESVRKEVARMRAVFRFRVGEKVHQRTELKEGQLNRRMLGKIMSSDRLFKQTTRHTDSGIAIGILLDESGSMGYAPSIPSDRYGSKAQRALQVGVLLAEALKGVRGVELELYSFTTCGDTRQDTKFEYLYGGNNTKMEAIANYGSGSANYDYQAIACAVEQMQRHTTEEKKLLVVVSDGAPCGHWNGLDAREATKRSVDAARKQGFTVLQIAIEDYVNSEDMYGKQWCIKFSDMSRLIDDMRRFVVRVVKSVTNV